jgi:hypothetical protein
MQLTQGRSNVWQSAKFWGLATCLLIAATSTRAHTFCVDNAAAFQAALTAASDGGANAHENNTIQIVIGTIYTANNGNAEFYYVNESTTRSLDVNGGYNSDCSIITENPALTVLDGGGATRVFESQSESGGVSLRFLTFQNGSIGTNDNGGGVLMNDGTGFNGSVIFDQNIVRNNHAVSYAGGFVIGLGGSGTLQFENNLIVGNSADINDGAGEIIDDGAGANIINSTFAQNTVNSSATGLTGGLYLYVGSATSPPPDTMSNNIFWANSGFDLATAAILVDNDFTSDRNVMDPSSGGNIAVDPHFSGSTDYHLLPTSPLLGLGTLEPTGGLPSVDIEGHSRESLNNKVDLGAYERGDEIFKDGFED